MYKIIAIEWKDSVYSISEMNAKEKMSMQKKVN